MSVRHVAEVVHVVDVLGPARGDRAIALEPRVVDEEHIARGGVELVLGHAGLRAAHRLHQAEAGDLRRAPDQRDLPLALDAAHLVEDRVQVAHLGARVTRAQQLDEPALPRRGAVPEVVRPRGLGADELAAALALVLGRAELREDRGGCRSAAAAAAGGARLACTSGQFVPPSPQRLDVVDARQIA